MTCKRCGTQFDPRRYEQMALPIVPDAAQYTTEDRRSRHRKAQSQRQASISPSLTLFASLWRGWSSAFCLL